MKSRKKDTSYYMNKISGLISQAMKHGINVSVKHNVDGATLFFKSSDGNGSLIALSGMKKEELEGGTV
jgi:hypothetical protein